MITDDLPKIFFEDFLLMFDIELQNFLFTLQCSAYIASVCFCSVWVAGLFHQARCEMLLHSSTRICHRFSKCVGQIDIHKTSRWIRQVFSWI